MTINLEIGWWLLPVAVTVAAFAYAARADRLANPGGNYGPYGSGYVYAVVVYAAALIVSLIAWLVWSLAT